MEHEIKSRNRKAPRNWARGHSPQSYGNQGYKECMRLLGGWKIRLFGETIMVVKFEVGLTADLDRIFTSSSIRIFGIEWSEDSRNVKS